MNNLIINLQETCSKKIQVCSCKLLANLVIQSIDKMEKRNTQLIDISQEHFDVYIRMQADEYLNKQKMILKIGYELLAKINKTIERIQNKTTIQQEFIEQLFEELDILNFMNFEVTKTYFSFLHEHKIEKREVEKREKTLTATAA